DFPLYKAKRDRGITDVAALALLRVCSSECTYLASNNDKATASGGADAPIPRSQGIGGKTLTGQKKEIPRLLTPKSKLRLGSWNVRTAFHCGQKEIIARELSKCRVTVAALSELRISGCGTTRVQVPATDD
ncbi:hypothetical protein OSTOST_02584, partial [Ostertagia ostertagi]